jgi:hypothetical protein
MAAIVEITYLLLKTSQAKTMRLLIAIAEGCAAIKLYLPATLLLQNGSSENQQVRALPKIIKVLKLFYKYPAIAILARPQWPRSL